MKRRQIFRAQASKSQTGSSSRRFTNSGPVSFIPTSISGCQLWLDAADSSTVTGTTSVTQWRDKSGNARHLGVGAGTTSYSSNAIQLNSSYMFIDSLVDLSKHSMFIVAKGTGQFNKTIFNAKPLFNVSWNSLDAFGFYLYTSDRAAYFTNTVNDADVTINANTTITQLYSCQTNETSSSGWVNGVSQTVRTLNATRTTTARGFAIGSEYYNNMHNNSGANASIYEILVYNTVLSTIQRQKVEGYLAHKWGLKTSLPTGHRYKTTAPTGATIPFLPNFIPGNQLWLDGADSSSSSMVLSGSNVTTWKDKSGNGYHMNTIAGSTIWSGTPEYPTIGTSINEKSTLRFSPQAGLKQAISLDGVKNLFWVGRIADATGSGTGPYYFLLGHDTNYDWHTPIGQKFIQSGAAQDGIANAFPASLFTSDANAVTNTAFSSINLPSPPNVSLLSVAGITGNSRYQGICYDRTTHIGWCGDLAEVVIFNSVLSTIDRQEVEGYLAHKWGLQATLPSNHPYKTTAPTG